MKIQYYILGLIFGLFTLTNCSWSQEKINLSIVKIFNKSGHGTGFFVKGKPGLCSVLTVAHVLKEKEKNYIETKDSKRWPIKEIKIRSSGIDLALLTFKPEGDKCNYLPLKIGNSESLKIYNPIYISGYPNRGLNGRPIMQSVEGKVSGVGSLAKGYGISYRAFTVGGMSGAPVLDKTGKVVAIHGMSDFEIVQRWESKQANLSEGQRELYDGAVKRINTDQRLTFSWGIPIFWFQESDLYYSNNSNWNLAWLWYCVLLIIGGYLIYSRIQYFQVSQVLKSVNKSPKLSRQEVEKKLKTVQKIQQQSPEELEKGKLFYFEVVKVNQSGEIISRNKESARQKIEDLGDGIELEMVKIP
ncbi:MAG: serine protease, partial [Trichodesmium sp. St19_bin1]|nr:serine protease [Trichodesmium sp. St19_bin1]